jgi:hypothetical protein
VADGAPVKIVLIELPGLLREILFETLSNQRDLVVLDELDMSQCPDFVILGADDGALREPYLEVLLACPGIRVIVMARGGTQGFLHELRPHATPLGDLSAAQILETIRTLSGSDS